MNQYKVDRHGRVVRASSFSVTSWLVLVLFLMVAGVATWWFYPYLWAVGTTLSALNKEPDVTPKVSWDLLETLDYKTGEASPELVQFVGQQVKIPGFIVLLDADFVDAEVEHITEFLIVPVYGMCIHIPPPPPNLMVHVKQKVGIQPEDWMMNGVWLKGTFAIQNVESDYGAAGFSMSNVTLEPLDMDELIEEVTDDNE